MVIVAALVGLFMAMDGVIIGFFLLALLPLPLLAFFPPLLFGTMGRYGQTRWHRASFGGASVLSLAIMVFLAVTVIPSLVLNPPRFLPKAKEGTRVARLEFRFPKVTRVVTDPHFQLRFYRGDAPEVVSLPDGSEALVFRGGGAVLSTWGDQMSVDERGFNIGGWMGAQTSDPEIRVTKKGEFGGPLSEIHVSVSETRVWEERGAHKRIRR
ncbi:hypothetical protein [Luteolibacter soli]|uniref:Uncharacterized protein n=1 Tax=Luteolibacter soli TaxID=3135280 RepID=A0ABU9AWK7_9BACT